MIKMQEILELSVADRISMVEKIWDSISPEDIQLSESHEQELDRRLQRFERGETSFVSWSDIKSEINSAK